MQVPPIRCHAAAPGRDGGEPGVANYEVAPDSLFDLPGEPYVRHDDAHDEATAAVVGGEEDGAMRLPYEPFVMESDEEPVSSNSGVRWLDKDSISLASEVRSPNRPCMQHASPRFM